MSSAATSGRNRKLKEKRQESCPTERSEKVKAIIVISSKISSPMGPFIIILAVKASWNGANISSCQRTSKMAKNSVSYRA